MSEKVAFLVLGPESSGTRLWTRILIGAGCLGDDGESQRLDSGLPDAPAIVWRRSIPHARCWPSIPMIVTDLRVARYKVAAVVTTRDWNAAMQSQVAAGHVPDIDTARANLQKAYPFITGALTSNQVPYVMASYEALVWRPGRFLRWMSGQLGLELGLLDTPIFDGNAKWYGEHEPFYT